MTKEKIRTLTSRAYLYMSCFRSYTIKGHPKYDEYLLFTVANNDGYIEFELTNLATQDVTKLENPAFDTYIFPLEKGAKYNFVIRAKLAKGSYKIQRKTIIDK